MNPGEPDDDEHPPRPLPRRDPRPLVVHALVDTAVVWLLLLIVLLFLGVSFWVILGVAAVLGVALAPLTRRAEERALAARPEPE